MGTHPVRLTSSEVGGLWANYVVGSMFVCVYNYYLAKVEDPEIKTILERALNLSREHVQVVKQIFEEEGHAIPLGFTEEDVHLEAAKLFSDDFFLYYTNQMAKGSLITYGAFLQNTFRADCRAFFTSCLTSAMELFNETTQLLLSKGLEVRSPYIPYLRDVTMVEKQHFLAGWWGEQRPLTAAEITHLYSNTLSNHLGAAVITGFGQVAQSQEIRAYYRRGKELSKKQVTIFSKFLNENDLPIPVSFDAYVYDSTEPPFSDKLMLFQISMMTAAGLVNYGSALSASPRRDIAAAYVRLQGEIGLFAEDGLQLQISHGWLERPPHAINREQLMK
ncbi:DUF3231 family protein [Pullulanibacillus sp. KACC 23026]|uniref:DUF3231 family protein n=1 Tax=Pullulanibacillus sp. KACC 23026 TaxID=3028315 RepID=UPI0023B0DF26|nr:DUF3231 family protein [Pullulanibacillus sp. KACC 23026]WEG13527.1 DUF3231 family protein [Pullulanibacillus sp. KACC 23026]